ncbi:rod shape-determining protein [Catenovulum sp. 2E275]|uniref:rod shape-determining protein n=1 Tax=Catenovulum sp. 2E275 TaxID=2980497 RepID=UPI0021CF3981|nr:rod shape-determining protein [Catenovulum sp. 2E275]MCU4674243.1 rod shape-determining protein [Catenovulum sp. 2E275]
MFTKLLSRFAPVIYVQIWENQLKVTDVTKGISFNDVPIVVIKTTDKGEKKISGVGKKASQSLKHDEVAVNPFSHPRVLFSDFYVGEKLLQHAIKNLSNTKWIRPRPKLIIHPMEKIEGGLTIIEQRTFRELALGAGASAVKLHTGSALITSNIKFNELNDEGVSDQQNISSGSILASSGVFVFYLVIVVMAIWLFDK